MLSVSEAKKCYHCGEIGHMANKCPHKKHGFSGYGPDHPRNPRNGTFTCHYCGGIGHKFAKCWEREENAHLRPPGWVSKMNKNVANAQYDVIVGNVESFESMEFSEQNVVKVADPDFEICCTAVDLAKVVESDYEIHGKACDDLVKVVESDYEIHSKACDNMVKVGGSKSEIHSMASEVNKLSDIKDVGGTESKQGRVSKVIALDSVVVA